MGSNIQMHWHCSQILGRGCVFRIPMANSCKSQIIYLGVKVHSIGNMRDVIVWKERTV